MTFASTSVQVAGETIEGVRLWGHSPTTASAGLLRREYGIPVAVITRLKHFTAAGSAVIANDFYPHC